MIWRQKPKPHWIGPARVLLQECSTLWLASGATIIKAKRNQARPATKRETLQSQLEGTAILKMPVPVDSLLRDFNGKYYWNLSGETPSEEQRMMDVAGTEVVQEPSGRAQSDTWKVSGGWLTRIHKAPRLGLFSPMRATLCPVPESRLTGRRKTII